MLKMHSKALLKKAQKTAEKMSKLASDSQNIKV